MGLLLESKFLMSGFETDENCYYFPRPSYLNGIMIQNLDDLLQIFTSQDRKNNKQGALSTCKDAHTEGS